MSRLSELITLPRLWGRRKRVILGRNHLLVRFAPAGANHIINPRLGGWLPRFEGFGRHNLETPVPKKPNYGPNRGKMALSQRPELA
jgi:hypothetical protein